MNDIDDSPDEPIVTKSSSRRVHTSAHLKQSFEYLFAMHLSHKGMPDNFSFIRMFVMSAMGDKAIREKVLKELDGLDNLGIKREDVLNSINYFRDVYIKTGTLRGLREQFISSDVASERVRQVIDQKLMEINRNLPAIQDYLWILLTAILKDTDIEFTKAPREWILHPDKYQEFSKNVEKKSYFGGSGANV